PRSPLFPYTTLFRSNQLCSSIIKGETFVSSFPKGDNLTFPALHIVEMKDVVFQAVFFIIFLDENHILFVRTDVIFINIGKAICLDRKSTRLNSSHVK